MHFVSDYFLFDICLCYHTMATHRKRQEPTVQSLPPAFKTPWPFIRMKATSKVMITVSFNESNPISQKSYDAVIEQVEPFCLSCTCGCSGSLIHYGSYRRHVKTGGAKLPLQIQRVLCRSCGRSHALLPSALVPYSQIPLEDQVAVAEACENGSSLSAVLESNPELDGRTPFKLVRTYLTFWRERLKAERILLRPLAVLSRRCLSLFGKQFMQIKNTPNIFFSPPT